MGSPRGAIPKSWDILLYAVSDRHKCRLVQGAFLYHIWVIFIKKYKKAEWFDSAHQPAEWFALLTIWAEKAEDKRSVVTPSLVT